MYQPLLTFLLIASFLLTGSPSRPKHRILIHTSKHENAQAQTLRDQWPRAARRPQAVYEIHPACTQVRAGRSAHLKKSQDSAGVRETKAQPSREDREGGGQLGDIVAARGGSGSVEGMRRAQKRGSSLNTWQLTQMRLKGHRIPRHRR